jgi:hypothetical protein
MTRISLLGLVSAFVICAALGCSDSSPPEREKDKTAVKAREEAVGGKFMRPVGTGKKDKKD